MIIAGAVLLLVVLVGGIPGGPAVGRAVGVTDVAQSDAPPTTLRELPEGAGHIIQKPNSGALPEDSGDRGGAAQILLFVLLAGAVGGGVTLVVRESRRKRSKA